MFVIVFVAGLAQGPGALVEWGASVGPRTTNGEWWRLVTSLFVHAGPLHLLACLVAFFPLGFVLERLVGSVALTAVYLTCGAFAGLVTLSASPLDVHAGATGAIAGLYGLALAVWIWRIVQQPRVTVPWGVLKWIAYTGLLFLAYTAASGVIAREAALVAFGIGVLCGIALGRGVGKGTIPVRRGLAVATTAFGLMLSAGVPLHGITDVRRDIDHMMVTDERTAAAFRAAASRLSVGRTTETAMVALIEDEVLPALEGEQPHLHTDSVVPAGQQAVLAAAREYLQLRIEGWRLRATALRKGSLTLLREADHQEGVARNVLVRIPYPLSSP
jgi:membrane associated rhomboid family serine protease